MPALYSTEHEREAYRMGADAGVAAASWVMDGNTDSEHVVRMVSMLGSVRGVGGRTYADVALRGDRRTRGQVVVGLRIAGVGYNLAGGIDDPDGELTAALCDAWEAGVDSTFESECERILRAALPDETEGN
jgi:hypothetical protein